MVRRAEGAAEGRGQGCRRRRYPRCCAQWVSLAQQACGEEGGMDRVKRIVSWVIRAPHGAHGKRECNGDGSWGQSEANQIMQVPTESVVVGSRRRHGGFSTTLIPGFSAPHFSILPLPTCRWRIPVVRPSVCEQIARPRFINSIDGGASNCARLRRPSD